MEHTGAFQWFELVTTDVKSAAGFYNKVLGWEITEVTMPYGNYTLAMVGEEAVAGFTDAATFQDYWPTELLPRWVGYIAVADVDAVVDAVEAAGGRVIKPCIDVPDVGRIAVIEDPAGADVGVMTPDTGAD